MITETLSLELRPQTPRMTVLAGGSAEQEIKLTNLTPLPDEFEITLEGLPATWYSISVTTLNLFPNWSETFGFRVEVADTVRPNIYVGRLIAASKTQAGARIEFPLEIEVLSPLTLSARLQPRRSSGYRANYNLIMRNRSMCQAMLNLQLTDTNPYCVAQFQPPQINIPAGMSQQVKVQIQLRPKTPKDQKRQLQPFELSIQPQWLVIGVPTVTPEVLVEGEYVPRSRWSFFARHPWLVINLLALAIFIILWSWFILPTIQNGVLLSTDKVQYQGVARNSIRVEQKAFSDTMQNVANPLAAMVELQVKFTEENQSVEIIWKTFLFTARMTGTLRVDPNTSELIFDADNTDQPNSFPWAFAPPNKAVQRLSAKLKGWLSTQDPAQKITKAEIEGNTLYLRLKPCAAGEPACTP